MRKHLVFLLLIVFFGVGCGQAAQGAPKEISKIRVTQSGQILLNGNPASLEEVKTELNRLKFLGGAVWYSRENAKGEPSQDAAAVFEQIMASGLPIKLSE